jgi:hypothetical protein
MLGGCSSSHTIIDNLPASVGGLPEGTPARPATPAAYPAVHDMPPPRNDTPLSEAERARLKAELIATRDRNAQAGAAPAEPAPAAPSP